MDRFRFIHLSLLLHFLFDPYPPVHLPYSDPSTAPVLDLSGFEIIAPQPLLGCTMQPAGGLVRHLGSMLGTQ